jgi:hypothetical protein
MFRDKMGNCCDEAAISEKNEYGKQTIMSGTYKASNEGIIHSCKLDIFPYLDASMVEDMTTRSL